MESMLFLGGLAQKFALPMSNLEAILTEKYKVVKLMVAMDG